MSPEWFELTISAGDRPQTYALQRAATGTGLTKCRSQKYVCRLAVPYMFKHSLWNLTSHTWLLRLLTFTRRLNVALMLKHNIQRKLGLLQYVPSCSCRIQNPLCFNLLLTCWSGYSLWGRTARRLRIFPSDLSGVHLARGQPDMLTDNPVEHNQLFPHSR